MNTLKSSLLKKGKKGFTLTELAIVIAVIAILIAVLVPTFTSVITSARRTSAAETAKNAITEYNIETYSTVPDGSYVVYGDYCWKVESASFEVSDDLDPEKVDYKKGMVQYSWGDEADAGISDVGLYIPATNMTQSVAKVLAQNYVTANGGTTFPAAYIGVEYDESNTATGTKIKLTDESTSIEGTSSSDSSESGSSDSESSDSESTDSSAADSSVATVTLPTYLYIFKVENGVASYCGKDKSVVSSGYDCKVSNGVYVFTATSGSSEATDNE